MIKEMKMYIVGLVLGMISMVISGKGLLQASDAIGTGPRGMKSFLADPTAETSPKILVGLVVSLTVGLIVIGYLFPVGMQAYHAINFTSAGMTTDEISIYGVLGIFAIICLLLAMIGVAVSVYDK